MKIYAKLSELRTLLISFLLFGLPFLVLPFGVSWFEAPKVIVAEATMIIILISYLLSVYTADFKPQTIASKLFCWIVKTKKLVTMKQFNNITVPLWIIIAFLFLLSLFSLIFHSSSVAFFGNQFRLQGVFLFWLLIGFCYIVSRTRTWIPGAKIISGLLFFELLATLTVASTIDGRAVGTLGEPNALAAYAVFLWPFLQESRSRKQWIHKIFLGLGTLFAIFIILFSGSRSGFIAFCIEITFFLCLKFGLSLSKATLFGFLLIAASLILPLLQTNVVYENRTDIWKSSLIAGFEHPVVGFGIGNTEIALKKYNWKLYNNIHGYYVDSSHNFVLDWWVQLGGLGLLAASLLLMDTVRSLIKQRKIREIGLLFGILTVMLFNPVSVVTLIAFWWVVGQGMNIEKNRKIH